MESSRTLPTVHSNSSADVFLTRMEPLLLAQEARYSLMLGIAMRVKSNPDAYGDAAPYFAVAEDGTGVAAAASMTPPYGLIVYSERRDPRPGLMAIAHDLRAKWWTLPTVNGPEPVCTEFAQLWAALNSIETEVVISERTFELRAVIPPRPCAGHMRQARLADRELLAQWLVDFTEEALHNVEAISLDEARKRMQDSIERGVLYVWEDGEAVSLTGATRPTLNGISIGPVYTPPQFRGRGYASACVAAVSQQMLDQGRTFCTLFTDLANPTSNHIYQAIGYRPICDYTVYRFTT